MMALIDGVTTQTNEDGELTYVTIDVKKHKDIISPVLEQLGVTEKNGWQEIPDDDEWITVEEARQHALKHIDEIWKK